MNLIEPPFVINMVSLMAFPLLIKRVIVLTNYAMLLVWLLHKFACLGIHNCGWSISHPPSHKLIDFQPILISRVRWLSPNFNGLKYWLWLLEHPPHIIAYMIPRPIEHPTQFLKVHNTTSHNMNKKSISLLWLLSIDTISIGILFH